MAEIIENIDLNVGKVEEEQPVIRRARRSKSDDAGKIRQRVRHVESGHSGRQRKVKARQPQKTEVGIAAVQTFLEETEGDIAKLKYSNERTGDLERACLVVDEALGLDQKLAARLQKLTADGGMTFHTWALERRLKLKNPESTEDFNQFLKTSIENFEDSHEKRLLGLTLIRRLWADGVDLGKLGNVMEQLLSDTPCTGPLAKLIGLLLDIDACLEESNIEGAANYFHTIASDRCFPIPLQTAAKVSVGFLYATHGYADEAIHIFKALNVVGALPAYAFETLTYLAATNGDDQILELLSEKFVVDKEAARHMDPSSRTLIASHARTTEDALILIEGVLRDAPHDVYAIERAVEWGYNLAQGKTKDGELLPSLEDAQRVHEYAANSVINALNARLDTELSDNARIATLCRLGSAYEAQPGFERAAGEVYREALELNPAYAPALRALGRIFARREDWTSLCQLYESEIAEMEGSSGCWRRHFQAAQIYENKLNLKDEALEHYRSALDGRPGYLPALKGASRILEVQKKWGELCDLYLKSSTKDFSRRQKLYLLDKVARIAEEEVKDVELAIGAWEELLHIAPEHPTAYTSLGRLLASTGKWEKLLDLNQKELELMDDPEEKVVMMVKNATLCEDVEKCNDIEGAERWYAEALRLVPDFMPALEGLGRIYVRGGRWKEVIEMTDAQLQMTTDIRERTRQLSALAEIYDLQLSRRDEAEKTYRKLLKLSPEDPIALDALIRYGYDSHDYELVERCREQLYSTPTNIESPYAYSDVEFMDTDYDLAELDEMDTCEIEAGRIRSTLHTEVVDVDDLTPTNPKISTKRIPTSSYRVASSNAYMYEFLASDYKAALHYWKNALELVPDDAHALDGYVRTAAVVKVPKCDQILFLEDLIGKPCSSDGQNRIYLALARLLESQENAAQAGCSYRSKSTQKSIESDFSIRFAMAAEKERRWLDTVRQENPHSGLDLLGSTLIELGNGRPVETLKVALTVADHTERTCMLSLCDPKVVNSFIQPTDSAELRFSADVYDAIEGRTLRPSASGACQFRLRGLHALQYRNQNKYLQALESEIQNLTSNDLIVSRLVEASNVTFDDDRERSQRLIYRAVECAFAPTLGRQLVADSPILDGLHESIVKGGHWELLKSALMSHLSFDGLEITRRARLMKLLAETFEAHGNELDAAQFLWSSIATFDASPEVLESLGRVASKRNDLATAIRAENERLSLETDQLRIVSIALLLSDLYDRAGKQDTGIRLLELVLEQLTDPYARTLIMRATAKLYIEKGEHKRAANLLEEILPEVATEDNLEDWRLLVSLYAKDLNQPGYAYDIQLQIVQATPSHGEEIDELIELAWEVDKIAHCCRALEDIARTLSVEGRHDEFVEVLKRVAIAYDEELHWADEAARVYRELTDIVPSDERMEYEQRLGFALAETPGYERDAHEVFQLLASKKPYDPTIYRGLFSLYTRIKANDRARVTSQALRALGCQVEVDQLRPKTIPSRELSQDVIEELLLADSLPFGLLRILRASRSFVERKWSARLPQRKALGGTRIREGVVYERMFDAMSLFGIQRFSLYIGESRSIHRPEVFHDNGTTVWLSESLLEGASEADIRFIAGWSAAIAWSELTSLLHLNPLDVYHLIEAARIEQTGAGFSKTISPRTKDFLRDVSSTLHTVQRRRLNQLIDEHEHDFVQLDPAFWNEAIESLAARVALLMAGDVDVAMRQTLIFRGETADLSTTHSRQKASRDNVATGILRFAMSNNYLGLRYAAGLSGPPSDI